MMTPEPQRGFALLIAVVLSSVALVLGISLLDIAYKQVLLASTAKQSHYAFYVADAALECALYHDQQLNTFGYTNSVSASDITCEGRAANSSGFSSVRDTGSQVLVTSFGLSCAGGGENARVDVYKYSSGQTYIYARGYNSCNASDTRRVERGLKVSY